MATAGDSNGDSNGDWKVVTRKKPYPTQWRISQQTETQSKPYLPYTKPTYAQILRRSSPAPTMTSHGRTSPPTSQPPSPTSQASTIYYVSPHSPSRLRFPPSHTFPEWRGRCFRCCRTGHSAAKCRNPKRCGKCWSYGHIGSKCKQDVVPPPPATNKTLPPPPATLQAEPNFEELLTGSFPYHTPEMPKERPQRVHCFIPRDADYHTELDRLARGVIMHTGGFPWELSVDNVSAYACRTNLVTKEEIQVSALSGSRFLILLPEGLHPDTFINATPTDAWEEGLSFQPWSPYDGAAISIPSYKILLSLVGLPPHLFRERHVAQAVSHFGLFLGTVAPENPSSLTSWTVAVAVDDLSLVPTELVLHVGGMVHYIQVHVLNWRRAPIYKANEMPTHPKVYHRPQPPPSSTSSLDNELGSDDWDLIPMSSRVLRDLCRGRTAGSLPSELRRFAGDDRMDLTRMVTHSMQAGNPADRAAETQHPSQTVQTVPLQSLDRIQPPPTEFDVAGHSGIFPTQHDSQRNSRCLIQSKQPMPANPGNREADPCDNYVAGLAVATLLQNNSCQKPPAASGPKPHRILSRGEPSKNVSAAVSVRADGAEFVRKETEILSPFEEHAKTLEVSKTDANSAKAQQKNRAQSTNTRPKLKPLRQGPLCIAPQSRKFKWTRPTPSNNAQVTKKLIAAASNKRKIVPSQAPGNPKRPVKGKEKQQAELSFNPEGFYEVQVHYDHISKLATGCGFTHKDVEEVIKIDNAQRQLASRTSTSADTMQTEQEPDLSRFEPDSSDELTSDEEEA